MTSSPTSPIEDTFLSRMCVEDLDARCAVPPSAGTPLSRCSLASLLSGTTQVAEAHGSDLADTPSPELPEDTYGNIESDDDNYI